MLILDKPIYKIKFTIVESFADLPDKMNVYKCINEILNAFGIESWLNYRGQLIIKYIVKSEE